MNYKLQIMGYGLWIFAFRRNASLGKTKYHRQTLHSVGMQPMKYENRIMNYKLLNY